MDKKSDNDYNNITFEDIKNNQTIRTYIENADKTLAAIGFNEHSFPHVTRTAVLAKNILKKLGYSENDQELAAISGFLHDIGNLVNRVDHAQSGAIMAFQILTNLNMNPLDVTTIVAAIGNHDEKTASPVNAVSAALILADKSDVRRTRVRNPERHFSQYDIHDRVGYAVEKSTMTVSDDNKFITLKIDLDEKFCTVMDYFEIFLDRMLLCKKAAHFFKLRFKLDINDTVIVK